MRLSAPRARRRSTVLGEPFLRAVSASAPNDAEPDPEPEQPADAPEAQPLDPFRAMLNLFNACQQADAEIAEIEETLADDPDALPPEAIVAPAQKLLAQTQSDIQRLPPGKASEHVIKTAQREGLAVSGRVLEADVRARKRFKAGAISNAADRLAGKVAEDPAALKPSLTMLNDLIETADLDPSDKRLIAANLEDRVRGAANTQNANPDASETPFDDDLTGLDPERLQEFRTASESDPAFFKQRAKATIDDAFARAEAQSQSDEAAAPILYRREIARAFGFAILAASTAGNPEFLDDVIRRAESLPATGGFRGLANMARQLLADNEGEPLAADVVANQILQVVAQQENLEADAGVGVVEPTGEILGAGLAKAVSRTLGMVAGSGRGRGGRGDRDAEERADRQRNREPERDSQADRDNEDGNGGRREDGEATQSRRLSADELRKQSPNDAGSFSENAFASDTDFLRFREIVHRGIPLGFTDPEHFAGFAAGLRSALSKSGFSDASLVMRGSSVTGRKFLKATGKYDGPAFDTSKRSDWDLAIIDASMLNKAKRARRRARTRFAQGGLRTSPLKPWQLREMGLDDIADAIDQLSVANKRELTIMIYRSQEALRKRGPALRLP